MASIDVPEDVYDALAIPEEERDDVLRLELALSLYEKDIFSFGKARELAGLSHREFRRFLADRQIPRHYTDEEVEEDVEYAQQ